MNNGKYLKPKKKRFKERFTTTCSMEKEVHLIATRFAEELSIPFNDLLVENLLYNLSLKSEMHKRVKKFKQKYVGNGE